MECRRTIKGKKIWIDNNNSEDTRPSSVEISLFRNGELYQSQTIPATGECSFEFLCLPVYKKPGEAYVYTVDEIQVPQGYTKSYDQKNIVNTLDIIEITYVFNNIVHNDYEGKVYTQQSFRCPAVKPVAIKKETEVFPEYTEGCKFLGWNTQANGNGIYYYPDDRVLFDENMTLYAIWQSCPPQIDPVYAGQNTVSGIGVVSKGGQGSLVMVHFSTSSYVATTTNNYNIWRLAVPIASRPLQSGVVITAYQVETGKKPSDNISTIVNP